MYNNADKLLRRIGEAKDQIRKLFVKQCAHGQQTTSLPVSAAACGQFLNVIVSPQRGLHGTAAAIRVLGGDTSQKTEPLVLRMVEYIRKRDVYEPNKLLKCRRDDNNVVKISEAVIALQRVPAASDVVAQLAQRLRSGFTQGQGWNWFLDDQGAPEPFPTAFACYALSCVGFGTDVDGARQYLKKYLQQNDPKNGSGKRHADTMTDVFCLYVMTVLTAGQTNSEERQVLKETFDRIWHRLEPLLVGDDLEQNIEYRDVDETCYVRIPWQPYLLALASYYRIQRKFSSWAAQTKLGHILDMVRDESYVYPYSGKFLSSRTHAILYEALEMIHRNVEHRQLLPLFFLWGNFVRLLRTRRARFLVFVLVTAALAYIGYHWYPLRREEDYSGIFINVISAWLFYALSWAQRSR
ncbi:MAG: hypothetical protein Q7N50_13220 [Armatimonadota bacterium]|nr:hypothetical protein [Armatimonadota bacterium]